jgi:hypothetical protein
VCLCIIVHDFMKLWGQIVEEKVDGRAYGCIVILL